MRVIKILRKLRGKYETFKRDVSRAQNREFHALAQCIRSDQLSARQVVEHMKDKEFREYYEDTFFDTLFITSSLDE